MELFRRFKATALDSDWDPSTKRSHFSWKLPKQQSALAPEGVWSNADLDPTPPSGQNWGVLTWWTFWLSAVADPASWQTGASIIPLGLSWRDAITIVIVGNIVIAIPIILNGVIGSKLRIPFPIAARASFGVYLSIFAIVSRIVLAWFWFGIECYNGGSAVSQMLRAMWPSYDNIPNHIPESAGITTKDMCSYFLYSVIQLGFFCISPSRLRYFFVAKTVIVPAVSFGMMGYLVHKAGGGGPLISQKSTLSGSAYTSAWLLCFAAIQGNWATLACNSPDFTRYSKGTRSQLTQLPAIPVCGLFIAVCGIVGASASQVVYGEALWSPFDILAQWSNRTAVWFCAFGWIIGSIGSNITANSVSAANDLTSLFPKYMNLKRGQLVTALIGGWAMVPWKVLATGETFLTFMSSYSVIMGPISACLTADYWFVKRGAYDVKALYNPHGIYRYSSGLNWRALLTLVLTITPNLPGLINAVNPDIYIGNISWYYAPGFITGYIPALVVYTLLNQLFPHVPTLISRAITAEDYYEQENLESMEKEKQRDANVVVLAA
ncbi:cytosine-purine permease [Armillaria gallica]|uniref:Cytosine-purine permease n=1 Tax=Armillaria gallica TaxID=47427 RepID=A0A2H3E6K6_ARMGA|nr:cytosine-purine permease [Armillaria gallica]